jgi:hypothetical protein
MAIVYEEPRPIDLLRQLIDLLKENNRLLTEINYHVGIKK